MCSGHPPAGPVRPRKLGHVVMGRRMRPPSQRFFTDGSDSRSANPGPALRHSCAVPPIITMCWCQQAPIPFVHHTAWQVDDVDEVGRGATAMLHEHPERHVWGLGRHHIGSNFFWYLKDPAGNFTEYYSDIDCIIDDALWQPGVWRAPKACTTGGHLRLPRSWRRGSRGPDDGIAFAVRRCVPSTLDDDE